MTLKEMTVLFVDDERYVLNSLERNLIREPYKKLFAVSAKTGLELIAQEPVHVVVSDMKMPEMDGLTFLRIVRDRHPEIIRMVLSGTPSVRKIIESINTGEIYRYIPKPLEEPEEFRTTIRQALEFYQLKQESAELMRMLEQSNKELIQWKQRVSQELEFAGILQRNLFSTTPFFNSICEARLFYRPNYDVGGDIFDISETPDGRVCVYIGDVSGHGIGPALVSTLMKAIVQDVLREYITGPAAVCSEIDRRFRRHILSSNMYTTLFLAIFDPSTSQWKAFNCGHPPPILLDCAANPLQVDFNEKGGVPIGFAFYKGDYSEADEVEFATSPGSLLLLYTDGLSEARRDSDGEMLGEKGLMGAAAAEAGMDGVHPGQIVKRLVDTGYSFGGDDCTLMAIRLHSQGSILLDLEVRPDLVEVSRLAEAVDQCLSKAGLEERAAGGASLLAMEHCSNIVRHGHPSKGSKIHFLMRRIGLGLQLVFRDQGKEWSCQRAAPDAERPDADVDGGRGLSIIHAVARSSEYHRKNCENVAVFLVPTSPDIPVNPSHGIGISSPTP